MKYENGFPRCNLNNLDEYRAWCEIKRRCYNTKSKAYYYYGKNGISISEEWKKSFYSFYKDMGKKPSKNHSIDRIDNTKGYSKENCRWATKSTQAQNRRTKGIVPYNGVYISYTRNKKFSGYLTQITINKKRKYIGYFRSAVMAAIAYDKELYKIDKLATLNFPHLKDNHALRK